MLTQALTKASVRDKFVRRAYNMWDKKDYVLGIKELVEIVKESDKNTFIYPAHAWTPWFGVFGSKSGFDNLKHAYEDQTHHIKALETGLSSDPIMNWALSALDNVT